MSKFYAMWRPSIVRALEAEHVSTDRDLAALSPAILLAHKGVGIGSLRRAEAFLAQSGLTFTGTDYRKSVEMPRMPLSAAVSGVYFVRCGEFIKIGRAKDVRKRVQDAGTFVPYPLTLVYLDQCPFQDTAARELAYHERFIAHWHMREWFRYEGALEAFLIERTA